VLKRPSSGFGEQASIGVAEEALNRRAAKKKRCEFISKPPGD
jgi:hypothetical protein